MKQGNLVWRLLRRNISVGQLVGYGFANLIGLAIVLTALQFYRDTTAPANDDEDSLISRDYIIASKTVSELGSMLGSSTSFSPAELADLKAQPWVESLGTFTPSRFRVSGAVEMGGRSMSTYMFFESIPDEFFDVRPEGWGNFNPGDTLYEVPIIISRDYLALYNFGFAASRGMPQLSEKLVSSVPLQLWISGRGFRQPMRGRVVGFSSRLNTIAVPENFLTWANATFADEPDDGSRSRVIIRTDDPGNPDIAKYFEAHGIETAGDSLNRGKAAYFLSIVSLLVVGVGVVISLLAFFILMLSIYLLLQKNREKLHDLMQLGYSPRRAAEPYVWLVAAVNGAILLLAVVAMLLLRNIWATPFENLGMETVSPLPTILVGIVLMLIVTEFNLLAIRRIVRRNF